MGADVGEDLRWELTRAAATLHQVVDLVESRPGQLDRAPVEGRAQHVAVERAVARLIDAPPRREGALELGVTDDPVLRRRATAMAATSHVSLCSNVSTPSWTVPVPSSTGPGTSNVRVAVSENAG